MPNMPGLGATIWILGSRLFASLKTTKLYKLKQEDRALFRGAFGQMEDGQMDRMIDITD